MGRTARGRKFDSFSQSLTSFLDKVVAQPRQKKLERERTLDFIDGLLEDQYSEAEVQKSLQDAEDIHVQEKRMAASESIAKRDTEAAISGQMVQDLGQQVNDGLAIKEADMKAEKVRQQLIPGGAVQPGSPIMSGITDSILQEEQQRQNAGRQFLEGQRRLFSQENLTPDMLRIMEGLNKVVSPTGRGAKSSQRDLMESILKTQADEQIRFGAGGARDQFETRKSDRALDAFREKEEERRISEQKRAAQRKELAAMRQSNTLKILDDADALRQGIDKGTITVEEAKSFIDSEISEMQKELDSIIRQGGEAISDVEINVLTSDARNLQKAIRKMEQTRRDVALRRRAGGEKPKITKAQVIDGLREQLDILTSNQQSIRQNQPTINQIRRKLQQLGATNE